ncbi:acyl-CoA dehydrogenase family protein [Halobellus ruber]|uniref:Acyl-CoA dehydrogenase family protein n=1 Tax=Halobellus ruber TaxID=2761102 RepID=A0A7J9SGA9_9EURY|nr:acyl-CoA dehydrogenase family protein [Halobellus ruber]MBB6646004.1 acyl-CoA dehydrogenase family protein [Halobellus ruber]
MELSEAESELRATAAEFAATEIEPVAVEFERENKHPRDIVRKAAEKGLTSAALPAEYGGGGLGITGNLVVREELYAADPGIAEAITGSMFGCEIIAAEGTEEQAERWVRPVTNGEIITGAAMTEPRGGSDFANTETRAVRDGDEYVINGEKIFIGNGPIADAVLVFARTADTDPPHRGISSFVVESGTEGFHQVELDEFAGPGAMSLGRLELDDARVPADALVGEEGEGFYQAMRTMNGSRLEIAASSIGAARGALDRTIDYISDREAFGDPVSERQAVRHRIAEYEARLEAVRSLTYEAARDLEEDADLAEEPAMAKLLASELAEEVASDAIQFHGGYGLLDEYRVEEYLRWTKIAQIYDGTSEIMRDIIAESAIDG